MRAINVRLFRILKLCCLILICLSFTGCLSMFGPSGCGHPPEVDNPNILVIDQRENYFYPEFGDKICYDGAAVYYLRTMGNGAQLCRVEPQQEPEMLYTFDRPVSEIACWKDAILVYGELPEEDGEKQHKDNLEERYGIYLFQKDNPAAGSISTLPDPEQNRQVVLNGRLEDIMFRRFPLRAVFNEETKNESFAYLKDALYPEWVGQQYSKEKQKTFLQLFGIPLEKEYNISSAYLFFNQIWMLDRGALILYGRYEDGIFEATGYSRFDNKARNGSPLYGGGAGDLFFYQDTPYAVKVSSDDVGIKPCDELEKDTSAVEFGGDEAFIKRFSGAGGRLQYLVIPKYKSDVQIYEWKDWYDVTYVTGQRILAIDLDTMQQTKELILTTPHEQVLYVSEAGAYTWRHDESRVFLTNWEGQSEPVSDTIPYMPRYETNEDKEQSDACNTWYAEVDPERSRLLIFDMTLGETALLAVVPVE